MAELSKDMVLKIAFAEVNEGDRRLLERVLADADGVTAFELSEDGTLVVSLHAPNGDEGLSRALAAAGMYPLSTQNLGASHRGEFNAC